MNSRNYRNYSNSNTAPKKYDYNTLENPTQTPRRKRLTPKEQRRRNRKKAFIKWWNKHIVTITVWTIIISIIAASAFITAKIISIRNNNTVNDYGRTKCYTTYMVEHGDTLWDIASEMCSVNPEYPDIRIYITEVRDINNLYDIKAGETIILPYFMYTNEKSSEIFNKYDIPVTNSVNTKE